MIEYSTKKGRTIGTLLFIASAVVYLLLSGAIIRGLNQQDNGVLRFVLTLLHEAILIIGGVKLLKSAEKGSGKFIGILLIAVAVIEFIASIAINLR